MMYVNLLAIVQKLRNTTTARGQKEDKESIEYYISYSFQKLP